MTNFENIGDYEMKMGKCEYEHCGEKATHYCPSTDSEVCEHCMNREVEENEWNTTYEDYEPIEKKCDCVIGYISFPDDPTFYTKSREFSFNEDKKDAWGLLILEFKHCSECGKKLRNY